MQQRNPRAGGARASGFHRADDAGTPNTKLLNPQLLVLTRAAFWSMTVPLMPWFGGVPLKLMRPTSCEGGGHD
jgi:hypothetical protein